MSAIVIDQATIQVMQMFEAFTRVPLKDCVVTESHITFIVPPGEAGRAIGAKGATVKRLEEKLRRRVKVVEFSEDPAIFIRNLLSPLAVKEVHQDPGDVLRIVPQDYRTRGLIIGRNAQNLRAVEAVVQRYFPIKELKVQ